MWTVDDVWVCILFFFLFVSVAAFLLEMGKMLHERNKDVFIPLIVTLSVLAMYALMQYLDN